MICIWIPNITEASEQVVDKVTVKLIVNPVPPERVAKRMANSVKTVGEQFLVGRTVSEIDNNKASYEKTIKEIFDRVLIGYGVQSVHLVPDSTTSIAVEVAPWGEVVHDASLEIDVSGLSPEMVDLVKQDLGNMEETINGVLIGLPVDSVDWAGGVSKAVIREIANSRLPEFRANLELVPGTRTIVKLSLSPLGPVVQDVTISMRSHTIPNVVLGTIREKINQAGKNLIGLPVAFVERHKDDLMANIKDAGAQHPIVKQYALDLSPAIYAGTDTDVALDVESNAYKVMLEGYMDMGNKEDNTSFRLHAGKIMNKRDEAFMEVDFIPSTVKWDFTSGWGHRFTARTIAGIKYDISDQHNILWLNQDFNRNISLRFERTTDSNRNELGIRYKLHDFLSAEYIVTKENKWLRLIGSL